MTVAKVSVSLDGGLLEWLDAQVKSQVWRTRSDAVGEALEALRRARLHDALIESAAAVTEEDMAEAQALCAGDPLTDMDGAVFETDAELREFYAAAGIEWRPEQPEERAR